jgi:glycosyltransferase involved in cell wall biosynthesis
MILWSDIVHLTGVYSFPTIPTLLLCRMLDRPVVWSPRGALQRWEGTTKILLKRAWENICNELVSHKRCIMHVTSEQEAAQSSDKIPNAGIAIVHNGVEIPSQLRARQWIPNGTLRLLYIGRLHPKKGIENLLEALSMLNDETVSLRVCGKGEDTYLLSLRKTVRQLGLERSVTFDGHVDGEDKLEAFMRADACVIPSFTENFGMVVAEALAHGVPVVTSRGTPWSDVEKHGCGLWIDNKPRAIADAIRSLRAMDLRAMGNKGRNWINAAYRWDAVGRSMITVYERLVTERP